MIDPDEVAAMIIRAANDGYHSRDDYPPYALAPWDDRLRWSEYIQKVAADVLRATLAQTTPSKESSR